MHAPLRASRQLAISSTNPSTRNRASTPQPPIHVKWVSWLQGTLEVSFFLFWEIDEAHPQNRLPCTRPPLNRITNHPRTSDSPHTSKYRTKHKRNKRNNTLPTLHRPQGKDPGSDTKICYTGEWHQDGLKEVSANRVTAIRHGGEQPESTRVAQEGDIRYLQDGPTKRTVLPYASWRPERLPGGS
jgi:hypothetical protein